MRRTGWLAISLGCLVISIVSLFTTVISYTDGDGGVTKYNIVDLIGSERFTREVLADYRGTLFWGVSTKLVLVFSIIGSLAILFAIVGILTMTKQGRDIGPFLLAVIGTIGTAIPSFVILLVIILSRAHFFVGTISAGLYPIITPIAMISCLITVTWKRRRTLEEIEAYEKAQGLIFKAGDI